MGYFLKPPGAVLDYAVDWSAVIADADIDDSIWTVAPAVEDDETGLRVQSSAISGARTAATLTGGRPGHVYRIANHIAFGPDRSDVRGFSVRIDPR